MRILRLGLAAVAAIVMALSVSPFFSGGEVAARGGEIWDEVCCGSLCTGGEPYCIGKGPYSCCTG